MLSLAALANWEAAVLASIGGATGSVADQDGQITRSGMYAEYPAIFDTYLELISKPSGDAATALEALKRVVFLAWYAFKALPTLSGMAELPESAVRQAMSELERAIVAGRTDDELRRMLAWYRQDFGYVFDHFGPVRGLDAFIGEVVSDAMWHDHGNAARFSGRGQLGKYWTAALARRPG